MGLFFAAVVRLFVRELGLSATLAGFLTVIFSLTFLPLILLELLESGGHLVRRWVIGGRESWVVDLIVQLCVEVPIPLLV